MGFTYIQGSGIKSGSNVNTFNASFAVLPQVGNGLVILIDGWNAGNLAFAEGNVTDNQGHGNYTLAGTISNNTGHGAAAIFYLDKITASAGTFTVTIGSNKSSGNFFDCALIEVGGFNNKLKLGPVSTLTGGAPNNARTGSISPSADDNFLCMVHEIASAEVSITVEVTSPVWTQEFEQLSFAANSPVEGNTKIVGPGT